ncbi:MAG: hypothetical protein V1839_01375 [archaeon]
MAKKGQAALEYLSTYGWLLIIIVIVAAALYALGIFNPATYQGKSCTGFSTGITYVDHSLDSTGKFTLVVNNGVGRSIDTNGAAKTNVSAVYSGTTYSGAPTFTPLTTSWSPGAKLTIATQLGPAFPTLTTGNAYTMTVTVNYATAEITSHKQTGTCTGTVE